MTRPRKKRRRTPPGKPIRGNTPEHQVARRAAIEARISREVETLDFTRRAVELRRLNKTYTEIAHTMSEERGEAVSVGKVRRYVLNALRNVDATNDVRFAEWDKLESMAARVRAKIEDYEARPEHLFDIEEYTKIVDTYLKYRDRIAKLLGLDEGGMNGGKSVVGKSLADQQAEVVASKHLHFHGSGSVDAYEEWQRLQGMGLTQLAHDVLALQAEGADESITGLHNDAAGTTLAPHIDITPRAEIEAGPQSSLEALAQMAQEDAPE